MLKPAILYKDEIEYKLALTWYEPRYDYYYCIPRRYLNEVPDNDTNYRNFAVVDPADNSVVAYFNYTIDREINGIMAVGIISFVDDGNPIVTHDLRTFVEEVFIKYGHQRMEFTVFVGSSMEARYDRLCEMFNGRVIGTRRRYYSTLNGEIGDCKMYEILCEDAFEALDKHGRLRQLMELGVKLPPTYYHWLRTKIDAVHEKEDN